MGSHMWRMIDGLDCGSTLRKLQASHTESKTQPAVYTIISGGPFYIFVLHGSEELLPLAL